MPRGSFALVVCVLGLVAIIASGCGVSADGPIPHSGGSALASPVAAQTQKPVDPNTVSGTVVLFTGSSPIEAKIMRSLIRGFHQKYPRIKVKFSAINRDYPTVVLTRFAGGAAPDIFVVDGKFFNDWASKGLLMPLDGYLEREQIDMSTYYSTLRESVIGPGGKTFALPTNYSTVALFTNDRMLAEAGVTAAPKTWDELEVASQKLSKLATSPTGKHPVGLCLVPTWERLLLFALQQDGGITDSAGQHMMVRTPETKKAITWVQHMLESGAATSPDMVGSSWCGDAFGKQTVAMALEGAWMLPVLRRQFPNVKWSAHPAPMGTRQATLAYSGNLAMSRTARNPEAAWLLMNYLASPGAQKQLSATGLAVPAIKGVQYPQELTPFSEGISYATVWSLPPGFFNSVLITADNEMSAVLEGKQSVDGMLGAIDQIGTTMLKADAS